MGSGVGSICVFGVKPFYAPRSPEGPPSYVPHTIFNRSTAAMRRGLFFLFMEHILMSD